MALMMSNYGVAHVSKIVKSWSIARKKQSIKFNIETQLPDPTYPDYLIHNYHTHPTPITLYTITIPTVPQLPLKHIITDNITYRSGRFQEAGHR